MEYYEQNLQNWISIQQSIFPLGIPAHCEWVDLNEMIRVLNKIGSINNINHMFYPTGGGLDLESAKLSEEKGCIELYTGTADILKPAVLSFEGFKDPIWNYFRIDTAELKSSGVYGESSDYSNEELTEISPLKYVSRSYWDESEYEGKNLPKSARLVTRHLKGSFVIFSKGSFYNRKSSTYDARHNKMTAKEFRNYIEKVSNHGW
ncbi:hypothetical protein ACFFGT_24235 [Mucilaginibacter angelicae]|uniref:Serine/threonine protein kinase n=1 Tax=Mucilaginibacter angelicae TaxID=869718 RepID=A0ABV6LCY2_9SPHI